MNEEVHVWIRKRTTKDGKTTFHGRWRDEQGKCHSRKLGGDEEKAKKNAERLSIELERGDTAAIKRCGWSEFVEEHAATLLGPDGAGKGHSRTVKQTLTEFGELMGVTRVKDATYAKCEAWLGKLAEKGQKASTIKQKLVLLKAALSKAVDRGYCVKNAARKLKARKPDDSEPREITEVEEKALLAKCEEIGDTRLATFIRLAIGTGARRNELVYLPWSRIDLDGLDIHLTKTKTGRPRHVPLRPDLAAELRKLVPSTQIVGGPFMTHRDDQWNDRFRVAADAAGLLDVTPHCCRDTFISRLLRKGKAITTVAKLVGHSNVATTARYYATVTPQDLRDAVNLLAPAVAG